MSITKSGVYPNKCENVYKNRKKSKIRNQEIYQNVQFLHYATLK
jgi:hypothetical protein